MPYQDILDGIYNEVSQIENTGKIADYIPELAKIDENKYGIALIDKHQNVGDLEFLHYLFLDSIVHGENF